MDSSPILIRTKQDVFNLINSGRVLSRHGWLIVLIALGGTFIDAYDFTSLGIGAVQLKTQFNLTAFQLGSVTASMAFGALLGALFGGYFVDKIGRLKMFLLDLFFFIVAAVFAALAPNLIWLLAFRFLMGVGVGLDFPVALSFIAEYTATQRKGRSVNLWQMTWYIAATLGFLVIIPAYLLGAGADLWRYAVGFGAIPAAIVLVLRYMYMDESPMWAANRGDIEGAVRILRKTYGVNVEAAPDATKPLLADTSAISLRDYKQIFTGIYRPRTILAGAIGMTQSMEYFALGFYLPTITLLIFGNNFTTALVGSAIFNAFGILGGGLNVLFTHRLGLRRLAMTGYTGVIIALLCIGVFGGFLPPLGAAVFVALFITAHSFGQGAVGMTMGAMSFPTAIRGIGSGFTQAVIRVGSILGFYFFPLVLAAVGLDRTLLILAIVPIIGFLFTRFIKWEPVGRDVDAEEVELAGETATRPAAAA
ncbi:MAG: MFS transporter [Actinobacteria bacterium]|nr:MFS transporter [Actinomycetota bacterium]